jgi:macrodomain Ter protein organizer (MatP/YcbG family)
MTKTADILKTDHTKQIAWLENQIKKNNTSIFLNSARAIDAFRALDGELFPTDESIEMYVSRFLSDSGKKKLVTTLRVAETRRKKSFLVSLQVNLDPNNNQRLTELAKQSGLTKTELINKMIQCANWKKKEEEQLEINL